MTTNNDLRQARYERACWWLVHGVDLVPLRPRSKHLQRGYGTHHAHITTTDFARQWFLHTEANLGVVLGGVHGLAVADWDNASNYEAWRHHSGATIKTLTEQTARGYHMFFLDGHLPSAVSEACEFKTRGVCMVAPSIHPAGVTYRVVNSAPLALLTDEKARRLFPFLSAQAVKPRDHEVDNALNSLTRQKENNGWASNDSVVMRIKAAWAVENEIKASGVELYPAGPGELIGLCPFNHGGHRDRQPSLWVNTLRQRWGCYAPSCESNVGGERAHDVVNYRALSRSLSAREAIKQLADEHLPSSKM